MTNAPAYYETELISAAICFIVQSNAGISLSLGEIWTKVQIVSAWLLRHSHSVASRPLRCVTGEIIFKDKREFSSIFQSLGCMAAKLHPQSEPRNGTANLVVQVLIYIQMLFSFSTPHLIRHLWQLKTVVFVHLCLIRAVLLEVDHEYLSKEHLLRGKDQNSRLPD